MRTPTGFNRPEQIGASELMKQASSVTVLKTSESGATVISTDLPNTPSQDKPSRKRQHFKGWRGGILIGIISTFLVLLVNFSVTVLFSTTHTGGTDGQRRILFKGSCNRVRQFNLAGHVLIAFLNTVLLSASSYAMQCLTAPTRADVDRAHQRQPRRLVEVGVMSFSNLMTISKDRVLMSVTMGLSSLVLHVLYSSTLYRSIDSRNYVVIPMTEATLNRDWSKSIPSSSMLASNYSWIGTSFEDVSSLATSRRLVKVDEKGCMNAYARVIQHERGDLILVTEELSSLESRAWMYHYDSIASLRHDTAEPHFSHCAAGPFDWMCGQFWKRSRPCTNMTTCSEAIAKWNWTEAPVWKPFGAAVLYCLYEKVEEQCVLRFSTQLAWAVTLLNTVKLFVLLWIFFLLEGNPLLTVGDAVMSFLVRPDITTKSLGMMGRLNIDWWRYKPRGPRYVRRHDGKKNMWWKGLSTGSALSVFLLWYFSFMAIIATYFLTSGRGTSEKSPWMQGFGAIDPQNFFNVEDDFLRVALLANSPQLLISIGYYGYNGLFTRFLVSDELSGYGVHRKGLRVSSTPHGSQRMTYFLQLPYTFAIPMIVASGALHWISSQSFYLVSIQRSKSLRNGNGSRDDKDGQEEYLTCGYSPLALLILCLAMQLMVIVGCVFGFHHLRSDMPVVGTFSAAISAMCHLPDDEDAEDAVKLPLQWGGTGFIEGDEYEGKALHCSFSSRCVQKPRRGQKCAAFGWRGPRIDAEIKERLIQAGLL